ncbi:potassium channel family protein [Anoxynatronum buryatiense]|uniref:potassium channel family protein n=1 Tax=Anoxynatronum buryatiense TaxID=489973 RepID=UPI0024B7977A|nr:potassium channel family protein [Anoxynatronum buryatiense]
MSTLVSKKRWANVYEWFMVILVVVVVIMLFIEYRLELSPQASILFQRVDTSILIIFALDYVIRLFWAEKKKTFIRSNIPDLVAIVPFSSVFRLARLARLTRLIRLTRTMRLVRVAVWLSRFKDKFSVFIRTNGLIYMVFITMAVTLMGAVSIYLLEDMSVIDSLWWSFVTITTVGYGDISPSTNGGKLLASVLMLVGIGFLGMVTGTIATYFLGDKKTEAVSYRDMTVQSIKLKLDDFDNLSEEEIDQMSAVLKSLLKKE